MKNASILLSACVLAPVVLWAALSRGAQSAPAAEERPTLVFYSGLNFTGESLVITETLFDLPEVGGTSRIDWNDRVKSMKVISGTWRLYQNGRCNTVIDETSLNDLDISKKELARGWSCLVSATSEGPVEFPRSEEGDWNNDISSVELVSPKNLPDWAMLR